MTTPYQRQIESDLTDIGKALSAKGLDATERERLLRRLLRVARRAASDPAYDPDRAAKLVAAQPKVTGTGADRMNGQLASAAHVLGRAAKWRSDGMTFAKLKYRFMGKTPADAIFIAQAAYMTGDMFGVSAALTLNPKAHVALFYDPCANSDRDARAHLLRFYDKSSDTWHPRVALIPTTDCEAAYRLSIDGRFPDTVFPSGVPEPLSKVGKCVPIGTATAMVADAYRAGAKKATAALQAEWLPTGWEDGSLRPVKGGKSLAEWVGKRFDTRNVYAFIWFRRSGTKGGAHPELDTSVKVTGELIEAVRIADPITKQWLIPNAKAVVIGDAGHGLSDKADIDFTEFWNDPGSPFTDGDRRTQLALFAYLNKRGITYMNIGMRSGALEGPALLGAKTVYMEELYNLQEGRMDKWDGPVPGYHRIALGHVPTEQGKRVLDQLILAGLERAGEDLTESVRGLAAASGIAEATVRELFAAAAGAGISPAKHIFDPAAPKACFDRLYAAMDKSLGGKIMSISEPSWKNCVYWGYGGIRAYQSQGKYLVKQKICADYDGPAEGLSKADKEALWNVIAHTIGGWETQ
ncbi:hypothetical protein [Actinomadura macrotermitis]|uniref:Uncharacterized protein n=1 Tax=Actinomadura macrotermitis TaxID=2585200 RepID=A0A7K0BU39_9ACTN|nr:hypothetical protein [Actinomadura macrotermitis]MQY04710.1 hypothetical protein [Actinomadura macrotermitis]